MTASRIGTGVLGTSTGMLGRTKKTNIDVFTGENRISGSVAVPGGGVHALLSNRNSDYFEMEDVYISRINEPGVIGSHYPSGFFRKDNINFVLLCDQRDGVPVGSSHARSIYSRGRDVECLITVPSFEITGTVKLDMNMSPPAMLSQSTSRYVLVFKATATAALVPGINYSGELILVDANQIGLFAVNK